MPCPLKFSGGGPNVERNLRRERSDWACLFSRLLQETITLGKNSPSARSAEKHFTRRGLNPLSGVERCPFSSSDLYRDPTGHRLRGEARTLVYVLVREGLFHEERKGRRIGCEIVGALGSTAFEKGRRQVVS